MTDPETYLLNQRSCVAVSNYLASIVFINSNICIHVTEKNVWDNQLISVSVRRYSQYYLFCLVFLG